MDERVTKFKRIEDDQNTQGRITFANARFRQASLQTPRNKALLGIKLLVQIRLANAIRRPVVASIPVD